ncbi:MAG: N-acetylglucosamine-6-phosphate deacetylase [Pyrinomonadaceae bacterium]|nr:N-acetylglucosamine-6-phosphate deacetylase [Pyrinomonadaceae bacterium]
MQAESITVDGKIPEGDGSRPVKIEIAMGLIASISEIDGETDRVILPGFIDVHNHGAVGVDVNAASPGELIEVSRFLSKKGVTGWLPTIVPDDPDNYRSAVDAIDRAMAVQTGEPVAQILGVHYEGVFANKEMCGALRKDYFREFTDVGQLESLPLPAKGVRMMTFAPEIEGGIALTRALIEERWIPSIGHTNAEPAILESVFSAGAHHITHFFNTMTGLHHRDLGVVGWALSKEETTFDIIADGIHVHPSVIRLAVDARGCDKVTLISDSIAPTGLGDGEYKVWGKSLSVTAGRTSIANGSIAGSVIGVDDAAKNMQLLGYSLEDVSRMSSLNPSKLLKLDETYGSIEVGKRADFVICDEGLQIKSVYIGGRRV